MTRSSEAMTSSAVKALPLWNLTPWRSLKRQSVGDTVSQDSRQRRLDLEVAGVADQPLIDVVQRGEREGVAEGIGVERRDLATCTPFQRLALLRVRRCA